MQFFEIFFGHALSTKAQSSNAHTNHFKSNKIILLFHIEYYCTTNPLSFYCIMFCAKNNCFNTLYTYFVVILYILHARTIDIKRTLS